jgi:hypothetical protein
LVSTSGQLRLFKQRIRELIEFLLGSCFLVAVSLLQLPSKLIFLAGDDIKIVVGQLAPLLPHLALELFPVPVLVYWSTEFSARFCSVRRNLGALNTNAQKNCWTIIPTTDRIRRLM